MNVPSELAKQMGLTPGCPVVFRYDEKANALSIVKVNSVTTDKGIEIEVNPQKA